MIDEAILAVANALSQGHTIEEIRRAFLQHKSWSEGDIFFMIKGGQILFQKRTEH